MSVGGGVDAVQVFGHFEFLERALDVAGGSVGGECRAGECAV